VITVRGWMIVAVFIWRRKILSGLVPGGSVFWSVEHSHSSLLYLSVHFQSPFQVLCIHNTAKFVSLPLCLH